VALILVASLANLNLSVANVALPDIGRDLDASQTQLNLVAVGFSLGLAASVLYLGALGDRYGRKMMLLLGVVLSIPASLLAAWAPNVEVLALARALRRPGRRHGVPDDARHHHRPLDRRPADQGHRPVVGHRRGGVRPGPLLAGAALEHYWWGSVFLLTLPIAAVALVMAVILIPSHVNESTDPVDNLGVCCPWCWSPRWCWASTSPRCRGRRRSRSVSASWRWPPRARSSSASAGPQPALRPQDRRPPHLLGGRPGRIIVFAP
jgi:MFS family permease